MFGILRPVSFPRASIGGSPLGGTAGVQQRPRLRVSVRAGGQVTGIRSVNAGGQRLLSGFITGGRA